MEIPSAAAVQDAALRLGIDAPVAGPGLVPTLPGLRVLGPVAPARHTGSVDVFLEALAAAPRGAILAVDNAGRLDEGCVGDLTAQACRDAGVEAMVVWGAHRDTKDLAAMRFPVWSLGRCPSGPRRLDPRPGDALEQAHLGHALVARRGDWLLADDDGVVVLPGSDRERLLAEARRIAATEAGQAAAARAGKPIAAQLDLQGYLAARAREPALTFRQHLQRRGGAIEV